MTYDFNLARVVFDKDMGKNGFFVVELRSGKHVLGHYNKLIAERVCDHINTEFRGKVCPLICALENIIKHYEVVAGPGVVPRSAVVSIARKALDELERSNKVGGCPDGE